MKVTFEKNGLFKEVKSGFSWTTFFFGGFAQIFRGEILIGILLLAFMYTGVYIIYAFFANKVTARRLTAEGWNVVNRGDPLVLNALRKWNIAT